MALTKEELKKWSKKDLINFALLRNDDAKDYSQNMAKLENKQTVGKIILRVLCIPIVVLATTLFMYPLIEFVKINNNLAGVFAFLIISEIVTLFIFLVSKIINL